MRNKAAKNEQRADSPGECDERDRTDMERLISVHEAALNDLMDRHAGKLFNHLTRCQQNEEDAAVAAQETFVRLYQHRAKFDSSQRFSTWLYAIAMNLVKDRYRWRSRHPQVSLDAEREQSGDGFRENLPASGPTPSESLQRDERGEAVRVAVASLPEELRQPFILAEYEERSHAEIGEMLGCCSAKAVETEPEQVNGWSADAHLARAAAIARQPWHAVGDGLTRSRQLASKIH